MDHHAQELLLLSASEIKATLVLGSNPASGGWAARGGGDSEARVGGMPTAAAVLRMLQHLLRACNRVAGSACDGRFMVWSPAASTVCLLFRV